jgi:hypothetical protein
MTFTSRFPFLAQAFACWNWKCALLSAAARSLVYGSALARCGPRGSFSIVLVEMTYVTLTAGVYAGMQQRALGLRSRLLGNLAVVIGVPGLAQALEWLTHRAVGAAAPAKATLAVCLFAAVSAFFHLHVMRRGAFLTGRHGQTLLEDFRRMPRLAAGFVVEPLRFLSAMAIRVARGVESEAAI